MCTLKISDTRDKIFSAMSKMQAELTNATKNKKGHGYSYSDLAECLETAKEPLANNGLAVTQMLGMSTNNEATLITMLVHESGEYIGSEFIMEKAVLGGGAGKNPAQAMGASITYMRRYAFASIIGLSQIDDDNASNTQKKQTTPKKEDEFHKAKKEFLGVLMQKLGTVEQCLDYCTSALSRKITKSDEITVQDLAIIKKYFDNGNSRPDFTVDDMPY